MSNQLTTAPQELCKGSETHVVPSPTWVSSLHYTYTGYVRHPGVDPQSPGHVMLSHVDGDDTFRSLEEAMEETIHVTRGIVNGMYPDFSVLSIVMCGY